MTPDRWKQIEEVFQTAVDLPPRERRQYIVEACTGDDTLREQVEQLVAQHDRAGDFIEEPAFAGADLPRQPDSDATTLATTDFYDDPSIGRKVGVYRILREIGRGGMGAVYLAERADSEFRRQVAIKLIKRGMDTDFILRRFRNERQILASLDHPYIARLLDGGTTEEGLPYFVMEYIEGLPIYRFSDERKLTIQQRLRLFRQVCDAVHYAHRHLVIHRDIKPSNILVTGEGVPKLLDFGIAKLLNPELADITLDPTATAMRLMTPEYASPEQVQGLTVTPSTDVYSLGVLLYELLTGHRPYRFLSRAPHEIARVICEERPAHPSVVITRAHDLLPTYVDAREADTLEFLYNNRGSTLETLRRELAGDLDNIVMKALRKEPERRYQSAEQLREDITRHLDGQPISAPPFFPVSIHTTASGNLEAATAENSIAVLPLKFLDARRGSTEDTNDEYLAVGLADALITRLSQLRRFSVRPTSSVMRYQALDSDPLVAGRELDVGFVLDGRIQHAGERIRVTVQLLDVWSGSAVWAGQFDEEFNDVLSLEDAITAQVAEAIVPHLTGDERRRLAKRSTDNPEAHEAYMRGRYYWSTFTEEGLAKALICYNQAVAHAPDYALAYTGIADYYNWLGIFAVLPFADTSAAAKEAALKAISLDDTLAEAYAALGFATIMHDFDWESCERHLRRSIELNPNYVTGRLWYSYFLGMAGRFEESLTQVRRAIEVAPLTPIAHHALCWTYYHARRYEESVATGRNLVANEPQYGLAFVFLSQPLWQTKKFKESIAAGLKGVELLGRSPYSLSWLATAYAAAGEREQAKAVLAEIEEMGSKRYVSPYFLAMIYCNLGDEERALSELERAVEIRDGRLVWAGVDPQFDRLRDHPRFEEVLRRTNNPLTSRHAPAPEVQTGQKAVAVLPLQVLSQGTTDETGNEYLSVGLADALITRLSNVHRFIVRPTSSVLRYQDASTDPVQAGRELGVDFVVASTIRIADGRIRVTSQLLSVADGATRWAGRFDENYTDVLTLEDSISEQVAVALVPHLSGDERRQLSKRGTDNAEAFEAFLRGRYYWYTMTEDGFAKAISCYERATALDSSYAAAYAGISEYHCWLAVYGLAPPAEQLEEARRAAERAIALDPTLAEAHTAHGLALLTHESQWELAEVRFRQAIELNPNSTMAHTHYACQLAMEGRFDESIHEAKRACEIDPINPFNSYILSWCLYQARRYDEGILQSRRLLQSEPHYGSSRFHLSIALRRVGRYEEAVTEALKAIELLGDIPMFIAALGSAYAEAGRTEEARKVLDRLRQMETARYVTPYHRAFVHIYLGERDEALRLLDESLNVGDPWIVWLGVEPQLDSLRGDPRFNELLSRTNNPTTVRHLTSVMELRAQSSQRPAQIVSSDAAPATPIPAHPPTEDEEANKLYVAGRYFATRRTAEGLRQGIERFERAVERDPQFSLAYAEMADCYALLNWYVEPPPEGAWEQARRAARRAVEADDQLAEAHASLGFVKLHYERDFDGAENEFRRAIELKPDNPVAHRWRAFNLSAMGRHEEAISEIRRAQEISPRSPVIATAFANVLFFAGRFQEANEQCQRSLELDPGSIPTHIVLRWTYEMRGMCKEALAVYEQERAFAGEMPNTRAKQAHVLASCGRTEEAREILNAIVAERDEKWVTAFEVAVIYAFLNERDEAFEWLAQAESENAVGLTYVRVDPRLNSLRDDPRFDELLKRRSKPVDPTGESAS
jgi:serine/threonine protein kinase/tetratricopeptide (TPR) repeat protein